MLASREVTDPVQDGISRVGGMVSHSLMGKPARKDYARALRNAIPWASVGATPHHIVQECRFPVGKGGT
jgi:hypothetical protein